MGIARGRGRVSEFDPERGTGLIEGDDGARLAFHCTQITDGTRDIAVGTEVRYDVVPGSLGAWEAATVELAE
jgi:cold shock CspA family protein